MSICGNLCTVRLGHNTGIKTCVPQKRLQHPCCCCLRTTSTMWPLQFLQDFDIGTLLLFISVLLIIGDYFRYKNPPNFPPGPMALPFVGSFFSVDTKHPHNYFIQVTWQTPPVSCKILLLRYWIFSRLCCSLIVLWCASPDESFTEPKLVPLQWWCRAP